VYSSVSKWFLFLALLKSFFSSYYGTTPPFLLRLPASYVPDSVLKPTAEVARVSKNSGVFICWGASDFLKEKENLFWACFGENRPKTGQQM